MSDENEDLAQLLAICNQEEDEDEEQLTEEELQQALSSPSLHRQVMDCADEESTECDDYDMSGDTNNDLNDDNSGQSGHKCVEVVSDETAVKVKGKANEYQFQMLEHHIFKGKHGKKLYKCDVCYAVYRHSFSLKRHFIRSHINYGYLCDTDVTNCGINLAASASLQTWKQQIIAQPLDTSATDLPELYCCHSCVLFFDDLSQIKAHVDDCHRNNKSGTIEPIRIPCSQCNMSFIQRHNLMRHIEVVHCGKRLYGCKHCNKKFQTIAERKKHEKSQHQCKQLSSSTEQSTPTTNCQKSSKTHKCLKCTKFFASFAELRKHVIKKHKEFYNSCGFCNKFCFSKKQLTLHLREKHEKTAKENSEKLRQKKKIVVREDTDNKTVPTPPVGTQTMSQQNQFQAYFHCSLCYRRFLTYGSLIRHKQIAHRPHVRHCSRLTADTHMDTEIVEPYNNVHEFEFYRNLAQKVAENLLYFVDGKYVNPCNDYKVIPNPNYLKAKPIPDINLSKYNFPVDYWRESSPPTTTNSEKLEFLFDCNLNTVKNPKFEPLILESAIDSMSTTETPPKPQYLCTACHQKISLELLAEHEVNNHPNVSCNYIESETLTDIPSQLLLWQYNSSEGLLHRCPTAPMLAKPQDDNKLSLKCTKCETSFASVGLLHNHILDCALNSDSKKSPIIKTSTKCHNSTQTNTSTIANSSSTSIASIVNTSNPIQSSNSDSLTETNTSVSSNATENAEFSSPLSPCKTRSGKRRQTTPEDYVKTKRTRNSSKNSTESSKTQKSNNSCEESVVKSEVIDNNNNKNSRKSGKEVVNSYESTANEVSKNNSSVSKSTECLPKRYSCKKCSKRFVYMDSLSKHQMSCKRLFNTKVNNKRKLRNSKQLAKNIELKAIKNLTKKEMKNIKNKSKSDDKNEENSVTNDETEVEENEENDEKSENKTIGEELETKSSNSNSDKIQTTEQNSSKQNKQQNSDQIVGSGSNESLNASGLQEHRCSDCLKVFTYLANFRKHIANVCPVRKQLSESTSTDSTTIQKSCEESTLPEVIVIKQEKPESDEKDIDCNEVITADGMVIEGEPNGEEDEDVLEISPKDESKLDLFRVKQENPLFAFKGSPAQHHSCPYCQRGFTYLANYRKHIKSICPIRQQIDEKKKQVIEDNEEPDGDTVKVKTELPPTLVYSPCSLSVRSQIEDTVLTLLRDQTKQDQILQSSEELIKSKTTPKSEDSSEKQSIQSSDIKTKSNSNNTCNESMETKADSKSDETDKTKDNIKKESQTPTKSSSFRFRTFPCNICHKIFLSYVAMLKHRLSHKLSDGQLANEDNNSTNNSNDSTVKSLAANETTESNDPNRDKEAANQALAASILKRSKDVIFSKMRINSSNSSTSNTSAANTASNAIKPVINTTELLEKLARGGITTDSIKSLNTTKSSNSKGQEVITIETNNNSSQTFNLQLSASTSANTCNNNLNNSNNNSNLEEIIIETNNLNDLELNVLKDGVIVTQDLQQLIDVNDEEDGSKCPEVLLNLDDIENANEVWITITDTNAFVEVPNDTNDTNNNSKS